VSFYDETSSISQVYFSHNKDTFEGGVKTNVVVAAFVTCQAR